MERRPNMWDERYSNNEYVYGTNPNEFLVSVVGDIPTGRALSLGDGEGRNGVFLAEQGFDVTAVDMSSVGLEKAESLARLHGVKVNTIVADLNHYVIEEGHWDLIVTIWLHVMPDLRQRIHSGIVDGLRPGGAVVLEAYTPKQLKYGTGGPPKRDMLFTPSMLREDFAVGAGLRIEVCQETEREVIEGCGHTGTGAVVQFLAYKPTP
jgi:SAM-dependent methyltransferase